MKTFLLRLDAEDMRRRKELEAYWLKRRGRKYPFADILRDLIFEKCAELRSKP